MTEVKTRPVRATMVESIMDAKNVPGAFKYFADGKNSPAGMNYVCPCGCGALAPLYFKPEPSPSWHWDGNREQPTLTPSVHHQGHWHGYLKAGVWESC